MKSAKIDFVYKVIALTLFCVFVLVQFARAEKWDTYTFNGVYTYAQVMGTTCEGCMFDVPSEIMDEKFIMNFSGTSAEVYKYIQTSLNGRNFKMTKSGNKVKVRPIEELQESAFIDKDGNVQIVPQKYKTLYVQADSIQRNVRDSLRTMEKQRLDSLEKEKKDSLANVTQKQIRKFELQFVQVDRNFVRNLGVNWNEILASGNLRGRLDLFDAWEILANEMNDTSFIRRKITLYVDTLAEVTWGNESNEVEKTYNDNGVITQEYKYRQYGITTKIEIKDSTYKLNYAVRNNDDLHTNFTANTTGNLEDSLELNGEMVRNVQRVQGVPFLSKIPLVGELFKKQTNENIKSIYYVVCIPVKLEKE